VRARREEDQEEEDYIFKPAKSLHFQNDAGNNKEAHVRRFPVLHLCVLLVFNTAISHAADCNSNGIEDACDVSCSNPGCSGVQGCGETPDCNGNGVPDECDIGGLYLGTQGY